MAKLIVVGATSSSSSILVLPHKSKTGLLPLCVLDGSQLPDMVEPIDK